MADGSHRQIEIKPGDTVVLSSNPIPGNEEEVARVINKLFGRGANVIYPPLAAVHVSGHASQEEQKLMLSLTRPRFFVPIHGELRHLYAHARLGRQLGIADENIFIMENGSVLELTEDTAQLADKVTSGNVFVDGAGVGDIGPVVMRERQVSGARWLCDRRGAGERGYRRGQRPARACLAWVRLSARWAGSTGPGGRACLAGGAQRCFTQITDHHRTGAGNPQPLFL